MLILPGMNRTPWWVAAETDDNWFDLFHTGKPFIGTESELNLMTEAIADEWQKKPDRPPLKKINTWPLAWAELTR